MGTQQILTKEEFVQVQAEKNRTWAMLDQQILQLYRQYVLDEEEAPDPEEALADEATRQRLERRRKRRRGQRLDDLMEKLAQRHGPKVYAMVSFHAKFQSEDKFDALAMGHEAALKKIYQDREAGTVTPGITAVFRAIYVNQANEFLRREYGYSLEDPEPDVAEPKKRRRPGRINEISIDAIAVDEDGNSTLEHFGIFSGNPTAERLYLQERSRLAHESLMLYYRELLDYAGEPQKPIAVLYARALYQILSRFAPEEIEASARTVMEKKGWKDTKENRVRALEFAQNPSVDASVKWAVSRMGRGKLAPLGRQAVEDLRKYFDPALCWGSHYHAVVGQPSPYMGGTVWGELVYVDAFSRGKISDWATDVHRAAVERAARKLEDQRIAQGASHRSMLCDYWKEGR